MGVVNPRHTIVVSINRTLFAGMQHIQILFSRKHFVICFLKIGGVVRVDGTWKQCNGVRKWVHMKTVEGIVSPRGCPLDFQYTQIKKQEIP